MALATLGALAAVAPAAGAEDLAASLYRPGIVNVIKLELSPAAIKALETEPEEYQPGTFSMAETDGTPAGIGEYSAPIEAQIRLKGSGSFKPLGHKSAFKVKFGKKAPFRGLRKMTLNNMIQDPTMVHEAIGYRVFHALGVPASRTSYAEVWVNGVNYGMHANVESLDKVSLEKRFGTFEDPPQHLYEGEYFTDVTPDRVALFEVDEGDEGDRSDLEALLEAHMHPGSDWSDAVDPYANLVEMTRMWMGEKYVGQFDGYSGWDGDWLPNNFYLYSDPAGRFRMFPWSLDWTFTFETPFGGSGGTLFDRCLNDMSCLAMYKAAGKRALATAPALDLDAMARCFALRLQPWQRREPPALEPPTAQAVAESVLATRKFIAAQPKKLAAYLGVPAPPAPQSGECPPYGAEAPESLEEPPADEIPGEEEGEEEEGGGEEEEEEGGEEEGGEEEEGGGEEEEPEEEGEGEEPIPTDPPALPSVPSIGSPPVLPAEGKPVLLLRVGRVSLDRHGLVIQVKAPRAGSLHLKVSGSGAGVVCETRRRVKAGGGTVGCRMETVELEAMATRRRWLTVGASLRTDAGEKLNCWRTLKSPRPSRSATR